MPRYDDTARQKLEALWEAHYDAVYAYAARRSDPDTASDAVADAFLVAWRRIDAVPNGDDALPWLIGVTRRTLANRLRSDRRLSRLVGRLRAVPIETAPNPADRGDTGRLAAAFATISPRDREAIALAAWEDLSPTEAATAMGCSVSAYKVRLHRARKRLRAQLDQPDRPTAQEPTR